MSSSTVYLCRVPPGRPDLWAKAAGQVLDRSGLLGFVGRNDRVAIKVHVGEPGLQTALPPEIAGAAARRIRERKAFPFFTDTAVLYTGRRSHGAGHAEVAAEHGYTLEHAGAAFLPADGLAGNLEVEVAIEGRHFERIGVAEAIATSNGAVVVSHATGHLAAGFGATLKNLGMGCASRKGKLLQHSDTKPYIHEEACGSCGLCVEHCPTGALTLNGSGRARLDESVCTGCGECLAHCRTGAVRFRWDAAPAALQEKMAEHALGVARALKGRAAYLLGIVNLTRHCDCWAEGSPLLAPDVGFAASSDPVALDQAALDLVETASGSPLDRLAWPELDGRVQLTHAEAIGLGKRAYTISDWELASR